MWGQLEMKYEDVIIIWDPQILIRDVPTVVGSGQYRPPL